MMTIRSINIMHHLNHEILMKIYLLYQNIIHQNEEFVILKSILNLLLNKPKSFVYQVSLLFFVLTDKKLSSHTDQISEHMNLSNHKIHSHNKMRDIIVNLGGKKFENNNSSTFQLYRIR